jgi:hypothetical protein
MSEDRDNQRSEADRKLEEEIRKERKFNLCEAIGRLAGPGAMKGVSPITRKQQAEAVIGNWLRQHLDEGGIEVVVLRYIAQSELLLNNYDQPLVVLAAYCQQVLGSAQLLKELVREADVEWGRVFGERPYFEHPGTAPNPNDPYTFESVRKTLSGLIDQLASSIAG